MIIYKTTNLVNGKFYIGKQATATKWYLGSGTALKAAIKKYGRENFKKEVLEEVSTLDELAEREKYWIEKYNALEEGYNIAEGGNGGMTFGGGVKKGNIPWNKGIKGKQKAWNKGTKGVMKANRTTFKPGKEHPQYGTKQSQETIDKRVMNNPRKRSVMDKDTGLVYSSISEASRDTNVPLLTVRNHITGKTRNNRFQYA